MTPPTLMVIAHPGRLVLRTREHAGRVRPGHPDGVGDLELDVHATSDGHLVVIHDDTVDRTTNGSGSVTSHTLATLASLDAGSWFHTKFTGERIPIFENVLERYKDRAHIQTEIKGRSADLSRRTVDLIRRFGMAKQVTITSFQKARLEEIRAFAPELPTGWLVADASDERIAEARTLGLTQLCPRADTVTREMVHRLHAEGLVVRAWGVATEDLMRQVVQAGVDGMTVNFPDKLLAYLKTTHTKPD